MTSSLLRHIRFPVEFCILLALVIVLPLLEAPKNLFWLSYLITWGINRFRSRDFGGSWDKWDTLILLWISVGYLIAPFAGLPQDEWGGANDVFRYVSVLWLVKRSGYGKQELVWLIGTIAISTAIAVADGMWNLMISHSNNTLELNSVGHVNHSAIYMAISFGSLLAALMAFWKELKTVARVFVVLLAIIFAGAVVISASRIATGVLLLLPIILGLVWLRQSHKPLTLLVLITVFFSSTIYVLNPEVLQKQEQLTNSHNILSDRPLIWNTSLLAWGKNPWFGVGMHNHGQITPDHVKAWQNEEGKKYQKEKYSFYSHAHSLYFNTLAERGIVGSTVIILVLLSWLYYLFNLLPKSEESSLRWALWGGSMSAWLVTTGIGLFNTTLHHEHGILTALMLGMWLAGERIARKHGLG